jgi:peptidoglycan-N-acetylglucosamine deacetylase
MPQEAAIWSAAAAGVAGVAATLTYGMVGYGSQLFGPTLVRPPLPQQVALTFDDGPNPIATPRLLETLARHNARATFFLIGQFVRREPELTRQIAAAGHIIGNHTMTHPYLPWRSARTIRQELTDCNHAIEDTIGQRVELFRPPHGARRPAVFRATRELNLKTVQWNLIVQDWQPVSAAIIHTRLERGWKRNHSRGHGTCVVLHDGGQSSLGEPRLPTVEATQLLLEGLPFETEFVTPLQW